MNRCRNPEHPYCTVWVMPGENTCAHGHPQAQDVSASDSPSGCDTMAVDTASPCADAATRVCSPPRPQLHISGFDPRAAGGRQTIRLDLRGMPGDCGPVVHMLVRSALRLTGGESYVFQRTSRGDWRPLFLEFSSRGLEHGQYRIDIELHSRHPDTGKAARTWNCSPVILVPRQDASLADIHQTFLASHKNLRVTADDAGIARVHAPVGGASFNVDVTARNASIAQLNLDGPTGMVELGMSAIAWDEDLIEIDLPAALDPHPCPANGACLLHAEGDFAARRHMRLFALDEWVLGRFETRPPEADLLLAHYGDGGVHLEGLTRRISARHALIRRGRSGFEIEDVSRYGLLVDDVWPGKHTPVPLQLGMRIELTASIRGIVTLEVTALWPHAVVLQRVDAGAHAECFYLMQPECEPAAAKPGACLARAAALPVLFHRDGGFWHLDRTTGQETPLAPSLGSGHLEGLGPSVSFLAEAYPDTSDACTRYRGPGERRRRLTAAACPV